MTFAKLLVKCDKRTVIIYWEYMRELSTTQTVVHGSNAGSTTGPRLVAAGTATRRPILARAFINRTLP